MSTEASAGSKELRTAARGGAVTLLGSATSSLLGFAFSLMLARFLGPRDSGVVVQAIAAFTIALSIGRLGADTCAVWILPPMVGAEPRRIRSTAVFLLVMSAAGTAAVALSWWVFRLVSGRPSSTDRAAVFDAISITTPFLPLAAVMVVALAATRAFGGVLPYNLINNVLAPGLRVVLLVVVVEFGGGVAAVSLGWGTTWAVGATAAAWVLARQVVRASPGDLREAAPRRKMLRFSLPRAYSSVLEQSVIWLDVLLVGLILGNHSAGVYGLAGRFVAAGVIVSTAIRIVVAPRFSALLAHGRIDELRELYSVTARWILVFGAPIYLGLAIFSPTVLAAMGEGFDEGRPAMVILCLGSIGLLAAGNVQSLLLMSGRSSWTAFNKSISLTFNVCGNLLTIPRFGITGSALTWAATMCLDTTLAVWQTHRATHVALQAWEVARTFVLVVVAVAGPAGAVALIWGQGIPQMLAAAVAACVGLAVMCFADRRRLQLTELKAIRG